MSFQGKEFSPEMIHFVVNLKGYFDREKKEGRLVSTLNPARRTAAGLGVNETTVKKIMARYHRGGIEEAVGSSGKRGKRPFRVHESLLPSIRDHIRDHNLKGRRVTIEKRSTTSLGKSILLTYPRRRFGVH